MIVEYDMDGRIFHVMFDPVPQEVIEELVSRDALFLSFSPHFGPDVEIPWIDEEGNQTTMLAQGPQVPFNVLPMTHYVDLETMEVRERPALDVPTEVSVVVGQGIDIMLPHDPFHIRVDGEELDVTGGKLELDPEMPATYQIDFNHFPYVDQSLKVTAHEA